MMRRTVSTSSAVRGLGLLRMARRLQIVNDVLLSSLPHLWDLEAEIHKFCSVFKNPNELLVGAKQDDEWSTDYFALDVANACDRSGLPAWPESVSIG